MINTGSSSLKLGLYVERGGEEQLVLDGLADGIGRDLGRLELKNAQGKLLHSEVLRLASEVNALDRAAHWLAEFSQGSPSAIGHRVVHGGPRLLTHQPITVALIKELESCVHFAPLHIPVALELIRTSQQAYPDIPQFACFDTTFHTTIPEEAARFALPRPLFDEGIHRYGFHGISYESIVHALGKDLLPRTVIAHLGSGASLTALKDGRSVDTTMGLTPTGGIPMATRSGDLDPGVMLYLLRVKQMNADSLEQLLNQDSGLTALSGGHADMRALEAAVEAGDEKARLTIDIFCTSIRKVIAAYAAVLGGLDMLVFSGGIGEHSERVRNTVCAGLQFLGIRSDAFGNDTESTTPSIEREAIRVRVVPSQEDLQIARHCRAMVKCGAAEAP